MDISKQFGFRLNPRVTRRDLLAGTAGAGVAAGLGSLYRSLSAPVENSVEGKVPFYDAYQAGIITPAPASALTVAFDTTARNKDDLARLFKILTQRIAFLMAGGTPPARDPKFPANDSGILGPEVVPDNLTITVAVGDSLFDARYGLRNLKPKRLTEMPSFPNDQL
jgi:deferrochelatase/peroxidase EfeB